MNGTGDLLNRLAQAAGLLTTWQDAAGAARVVEPDTLRAVLSALRLPCETPDQCHAALQHLQQGDADACDTGLHILRPGEALVLRVQGSLHYRLLHEDGSRIMGTACDVGGGRGWIGPIQRPGYHHLEMGRLRCTVAVIPRKAPPVQGLLRRGPVSDTHGQAPERDWVLGVQAYGLWRGTAALQAAADAGRPVPAGWETGGDFALLGRLAQEAARHGAAGLAISPVHAMFSADSTRYSPYAPSSRLFLNPLYVDPAASLPLDIVAALAPSDGRLMMDPDGSMDWPAIHALRLSQLRRAFNAFEQRSSETMKDALAAFCRDGGEALHSHACYEALHAHFLPTLGAGHGWRDWPAEYRDPQSEAVRRFARDHETEIRFHGFLQWLAARGMADAQARAVEQMPLGLIADMAVGTDPRGSHAWSRQDQILSGVSVGAPPDIFQPQGQNWGLTAFSPRGLQQHAYSGFIETLRAVLAHAGGLRVDHVMGMARMWLVPEEARAHQGVYIQYPMEDMLDLLMLEAWRHDAVVVGENLGTVPEGFNRALEQRGILGMSVLWFEQEAGETPRFRLPGQWPQQTLAMAGTHDLPTVRGWWKGRDIDWQLRQGDVDEAQARSQRRSREAQKRALWSALQAAGLAQAGAAMPAEAPAADILGYVAATPAVLASVALEDLAGQEEQPNLPGSPRADAPTRHPNWRRMQAQPVETILRGPESLALLQALRERRAAPGPAGRGA